MALSKTYLAKILEPGERKIAETGLHPIYLVTGLLWFCGLAGFGWASDIILWSKYGRFVPDHFFEIGGLRIGLKEGWIGIFLTLTASTIFLKQLVRFFTTHILVTSKRLVYKTGFINIKLDGTEISDIRAFHVDQGWLGQFFGYGSIRLDSRFVNDMSLPCARNPYQIVREMEKVRSSHWDPEDAPFASGGHAAAAPQVIVQFSGEAQKDVEISHPSRDTIHIHAGKEMKENHHKDDILLEDFRDRTNRKN
jgi:hypothetical protein